MGSIIKEDTEGEPSAVLTETGKGGLFSEGYLRDAPAREYVGEGETAVFVLTDDEVGVERVQGNERGDAGERTTIAPGKGYRAITVVTDRRVIALVGNAGDGGDKRVTLPLVETGAARAADGALVLEMCSGVTWRCHAGAAGIEDVAEYVGAAAEAWRDVEETADSVKRSIVAATGHRDEGDYDAALAAMCEARDDIEAVQDRTASFGARWPSEAMADRVERLRDRCLRTAAEIRVGYARATIDDGEKQWRAGEYERARDAFEAAREAYEAVRSLAPRHRSEVDDVEGALERLDRSIERLDDAPLRNAIDADRRARETEASLEALDALAEARERYEIVLELDPNSDERRFAGDRDRIREQREDVTDRFVDTALTVGTDALEAGEWHTQTGQVDLAEEELGRAVDALDRGLAVAETERPAEAEHLRKQRSAAEDYLADVHADERAGSDDSTSEDTDPVDADEDTDPVDSTGENTDQVDSDDDGNARAARGEDGLSERGDTDSETAERGAAAEAAAADGGLVPEPESVTDSATNTRQATADSTGEAERFEGESIEGMLRALAPEEFERVVTTVVEAMGWRPEPTASSACDYLARRSGEARGTLAIRSFANVDGEPLDPETVREAATLASSIPSVEDVLIVTTRPLTDAATAAARSRDVRVLDVDYLATALGGPDATDVGSVVSAAKN